jgi:formyl transferase-like protein
MSGTWQLRCALPSRLSAPRSSLFLSSACVAAGHEPVAYVYRRSMKPKGRTDARTAAVAGRLLEALPAGMDLLLPGTAEGLADALAGYRLDLLVVYGFNWRLPAAVLRTPRSGVINIHSSLLPRYRGLAPVLWAIRNGDAEIGLTVHRMDERFDTGPILLSGAGSRWMRTPPRSGCGSVSAPSSTRCSASRWTRCREAFPGFPRMMPAHRMRGSWSRSRWWTGRGPRRRCTTRCGCSGSWARITLRSPRSVTGG